MNDSRRLELDINFLARLPLWPPVACHSRVLGSAMARDIPVLDLHELTAGKLAALFSRDASRDLFDVHGLLTRGGFDRQRLRLASDSAMQDRIRAHPALLWKALNARKRAGLAIPAEESAPA